MPHSAWQSDAFGTSAAFPIFLSRFDIPYLFIGRSQHRCAPNDATCQALPQAFYWRSPAAPDVRVLVAYISYPTAWDAIHQLPDEDAQLAALRTVVDQQFQRTTSKYIFLPMGSDFIDPMSDLSSLIDRWNASDKSTVLVMADPDTAFQYLATQNLPEFTVDLNPIWQAFYASRPYAKIADKESAYFLTAAEDFGKAIDAPQSAAWLTATINAHYDNVGAVSFDTIWESTQRPRFEQTVATAAADLSHTLARIASNASSVDSPLLVFNPSTWPRSGIVEIEGDLPPPGQLPAPAQQIAPGHIAFHVSNVPPIGYASPIRSQAVITQPATVSQSDPLVTLANGLVTVTLDADHGGVFSRLIAASTEILSGPGDDVTYIDDNGDIYGSFFGAVRTRESQTPAHIKVLAAGPLIARAQAIFALGGQAVTKTVTLRAGEPVVDVQLDIKALPQTTALVQTPTTIDTTSRTDDLGFTSFTHPIDSRPIVSGDVTYRREIFYPIMYWSDVSADGVGLGLITHGLQGLGGTGTLSLMLVRQVDDQGHEGVTDAVYHTLRYAYVPHVGAGVDLPHLADEFNQPLIPVWRSGDQPVVQLPFQRNN